MAGTLGEAFEGSLAKFAGYFVLFAGVIYLLKLLLGLTFELGFTF